MANNDTPAPEPSRGRDAVTYVTVRNESQRYIGLPDGTDLKPPIDGKMELTFGSTAKIEKSVWEGWLKDYPAIKRAHERRELLA